MDKYRIFFKKNIICLKSSKWIEYYPDCLKYFSFSIDVDDDEEDDSPNISMSSLNSSFRSFPSSRSNSPPPTKKFKLDDSMQPNYDRCKICKNIVGKYLLSSIVNEPMRRNPMSHDYNDITSHNCKGFSLLSNNFFWAKFFFSSKL